MGVLSLAQERDSVKVADVLKNEIKNLSIVTHKPYSMNDKKPKILYPDVNKTEYPDAFFNGNPACFETIRVIDPKNIEHIEIEKSNDLHAGKDKKRVIIKTKTEMISMRDFIKKYSIKSGHKILVSIDGEMINESFENLLLDESYIMQVKVSDLDKIDHNNTFTHLKIFTRTAENVRKANEIRLR
ncbi:hypothetical protein ASG21_05670 [Chryseobacterium sp. Leaf394]|nr:hypothetical protein ASG21_05670 [Chryseobacterium sp. Leaf394]